MNSKGRESSSFGRSVRTYAVGIGGMATTALGVFGAFCFYVVALRGPRSFVEIVQAASDLLVLVFVWCIGRKDKPGTPEGQLTSLTLWVFSLLLCVHLIYPFARTYSPEEADKWIYPVTGLSTALPVLWGFLRGKMVDAATRKTQGRPRQE